jgi:hypothetical protein
MNMTLEGVEVYVGRLGAIAFQHTKQRIVFFHDQGKMVDGTPAIVPTAFAMVARAVNGVSPTLFGVF